jgi:succinylglutamate desuccinylase
MLCNLVCKLMGRHAHVDICRGFDLHNSRTQHITKRISPNPHQEKDWITHSLHWLRMGNIVALLLQLTTLMLLPGFKGD